MIGFKIDKTIDPWFQEGHELGILEGIEKGIEKGMEKGLEKGIEKGEKYKAVKTAIKMLRANKDGAEIMEFTELTEIEMRMVKAFYDKFGSDAIHHLNITDKEISVK